MINSKHVIEEIIQSVIECSDYDHIDGSLSFLQQIIAKYSVIDLTFGMDLNNAKYGSVYIEQDYRPEIKAAAEKLKMMLYTKTSDPDYYVTQLNLRVKIHELIRRGKVIRVKEHHDEFPGLNSEEISGPLFSEWIREVQVLNERDITGHPLCESIKKNYNYNGSEPSSMDNIIACLEVIEKDREFFLRASKERNNEQPKKTVSSATRNIFVMNSKKIFLVHGHDEAMKQSVARVLEKAELEPVILHEQPNEGQTIIEKFEKHTDVAFAIVLYSPCDMGRPSESNYENEKPRARQNVVFEHGYLIGKLGREKVRALVKGDVETPSDIAGILYTPMDERGAWKNELAKEMEKAGLDFNLRALIY